MPPTRPCKRCGRNRAERFYTSARGHICADCRRAAVRRNARNGRLTDLYGIDHDEYDQILAAQQGGCAICGRTPRYQLDVDHDHKLEREVGTRRPSIRGLLCKPCNRRLLPAARDDVRVLEAAIRYLSDPPARSVL